MDTRRELDERLLREARARAEGAMLRRVLGLIAAAFLFVVYGAQSNQAALGIGAAVVLVGAAVYVLMVERKRNG